MKRRILSLIMTFVLCLSLLPTEVLAEETEIITEAGEEETGESQNESEEETGESQNEGEEETGENQNESEEETGESQNEGEEETGENQNESEEETGESQNEGEEETGENQNESEEETGENQNESEEETGENPNEGEEETGESPNEGEEETGVSLQSVGNSEDNVAEVTVGGTTTQYTDINEAFTAAQEADSATVTLLSDVTIAEANNGIYLAEGNITFDLNGHTLTSFTGSDWMPDIVLYVNGMGGDTPTYAALTLQDSSNGSGKIVQTNGIPAVLVDEYGKLTVEGGIIENSTTDNRDILAAYRINCAILTSGETIIRGGTMSGINGVVVNGGTLTATDGTFTGTTGNALIVHDGTAQLSGGTYSNDTDKNEHSIWVMNDGKAKNLLAEGYRYETTDGKVSAYSENGNGVVGNTTVKERPAGEFFYIDATGKEAVQTGCKELTSEALYGDSDNVVGGTMWYAASGDITLDKDLSVRGTLNLILCDGATVTAGYGIFLGYSEGAGVLNIYAQSAGTGRLTVTNDGQNQGRSAGIVSSCDGSSLNIYGGTVTATGTACVPTTVGEPDYSGAGIGTCANDQGGITLNVNIYGGTVIAKSGGKGAAAIGNGQDATGTVNVTIADGMKCVQTDDLNTPAAYDNTDGISVTITKCSDHQYEYEHTEGEETHTSSCKLCGTDGATEAHTYENWKADEDADTHTGTCECGAEKTEDHTLAYRLSTDKKSHYSECSICGYKSAEERHDTNGTDGSCSVCGADKDVAVEKVEVTITAPDDTVTTTKYTDLIKAFDDADTSRATKIEVRLLQSGKTYTLDSTKGFPIEFRYTNQVEVIVDLNGCTLKRSVTDDAYGILKVEKGNVTIKNGTLDLDDSDSGNFAKAIMIPGNCQRVMTLTLENMTVNAEKGYAIYTEGESTLYIKSGVYGEVLINDNVVTAKLSGGSYGLVWCYGDYAGLLEKEYIFAQQDGAYIDPGTMKDNSETGKRENIENIKVIPCTHEGSFTDGKCNRCGYVCEHKTVTNGECTTCGTQMAAKVGETYFTTLAAAIEAAKDNGTVTLLADVSENVTVEAGKKVTFDFNGHSWNAWGTHTITVNGNVTVTGNGVMQNSNKNVNDIFVSDGGQVHLTAGMTFSRVWAHDNASVTLDAGVIITNNIFSGGSDISGLFTGKALQRYDLGSEEPVEGSYVPLNKNYDMYPTGCVIVIEHTKHVYESGTTGYCDVCGAACDHANMKITDQNCPDCHAEYVASVVLTDVNGAAYPERFTVLQEALEYANSAWIAGTDVKVKKAELTLLKDETVTGATGEVCTFNELTADMTVDINLNGKTLTCGSRFLVIYGGKVSIHDGSIHCTNAKSVSAIYVVRAESLNPELTLTNVNITTTSDEFNETFSVRVHDGKLTIQGEGQYSVLEVYESDGVQLFGGSFEGIKMPAGDDFTSLLAEGYIYEDESGNFMSGDALANQAESTMNSIRGYRTNAVRVVKCENHDFEASKCTKCGFACLHKDGEESTLNYGVCTVCGYVCPHEHLSEADGVTTCSDCKAQMAVKVEHTEENGAQQTKYYAQTFDDRTNTENTLQTILNDDTITPSGSTITLLAKDLWAFAFVYDGKTVTLNLNGKNLIETGNGIAVDKYSKLIVTGEGTSTQPTYLTEDQYSYVFNVRGGTLEFHVFDFGGTFNGIRVGSGTLISPREKLDSIHIGTLELADAGAKVSFKAAAFDKIAFDGTSGSVKLGDLLGVWKDSEGNTFHSGNAFQTADGTLLRYDTEITGANPVENVKTAACHHDSVTGRTCDYCGMENLTAIVVDGGGAIATYAATDDSTEAEKTSVGYALNGWKNNGNNKTLKLFVDVTLTADVSLDAVKHPGTGVNLKTTRVIDLNGHSFTGAGGTAYGMVVNELVTLTVKDNSAGKKGEFVNVTVNDGGSLIVDGVHVGTITAAAPAAKVTLKAGSSLEGYSLPAGMMLADWIEDGCFIYDTGADGNARIPVALTTTGTGEAAGKFVVEKAAVKVTAGITTGEIVYGSGVPTEFCPEVTLTDTSAYENFGFIKVDWYRRTDSGCKQIGSGTIKDGSYAVTLITPDFDGVKAGDILEVFCTITAVDNTGAEFWQTAITGYKLEVVKGNSSVITAPKATVLMVYRAGATDKKWSLVTKGTAEGGTMVYSLSKDGEYTETIPTAENAGSYTVWYKVSGDENHIDTEPESVTAKIERVPIRISSFELKEKIYDGTTGAEVIVVNFQDSSGNTVGSELALGMDYTVKAEFDDANVGSDVSVTVRVIPQDTVQMGNYLLDGKVLGTREIQKAAAPAAAEGTLYILNSRMGTYTFDLSRLLPGLDEGCEFGDVTFSVAQVKMKDGTEFDVTAEVDGKLLGLRTLAIAAEEGEVGTAEIKVVTDNYKDFTLTVKIVSTDKKIVELKEGSTVAVAGSNQLTYGQKLSELTLGSAVFVELDTDIEIKGTLKWSNPDAVPDAGTTLAEWIFVPEDALYKEVTGFASIKVEKATPVVTELPTVAEREYNPYRALTAADLTGGAASVDGQWSWKQTGTDIIPTVGNAGYEAVFTPQDTTNYNTVTRTIAVKVTKATPYIGEKPSAAAITYGATLADSTLTGGKAYYESMGGSEIAGSFVWKQTDVKPTVSDSQVTEYEVTFVPTEAGNYNPVETKIVLTVNKAAQPPTMPETSMTPAHSIAKVGNVTLPKGWSWSDADKDKELEDKVPVIAEAIYTGADRGNYETESVIITLTRSDCRHRNTVIRNREGATCFSEGYTGDTYCKDCGSLVATGRTIRRKEHTVGTPATCVSGEVCSVCGEQINGADTSNHVHTSVENRKEATCTAEGYTGDIYCTDCGTKLTTGTVIAKTPHTAGTAATCVSRAVCSVCGEPFGEVDASHHILTIMENQKDATCTQTGNTGDVRCVDCGNLLTEGEEIAALGHEYQSVVTKEPTQTEEGVRTYTCSRCNDSYTESIAKLPVEETHTHSYTESATEQATCTETGVRTFICSCNDSYTEEIPALGHSYTSAVTKEATQTEEGILTYTCTRCGHTYTKPIAKITGGTSGGEGETGTETEGKPYMKDDSGKRGWDAIEAQMDHAEAGSTVTVAMNGTTIVPKSVLDSIKGEEIALVLEMESGLAWKLSGKEITEAVGDIDLGVTMGDEAGKSIPVEILNQLTGERESVNLTLAYDGRFGFTATLLIQMDSENAGLYANLFYYNAQTGELEFISAGQIGANGSAELTFTHASDYTVVIDTGIMREDAARETGDSEPGTLPAANTDETGMLPWKRILIVVAGIGVVLLVTGSVWFVKKKKRNSVK